MDQFKVGDRVSVSGIIDDKTFKGHVGTIVSIDTDSSLDVEFENWDKGHDGSTCDHRITSHWFIAKTHFKKVTLLERTQAPVASGPSLLPQDAKERKKIPLAGGLFDYFTSALIEVAKVSFEGNQQHNPGEPLHWAQDKSTDHADTLLRHLAERGTRDTDGQRHSAKAAWRALALLQMELQNEGYPKARGAK